MASFIDDEAEASSDEESVDRSYSAKEKEREMTDAEARSVIALQDKRRKGLSQFNPDEINVQQMAADIEARHRAQAERLKSYADAGKSIGGGGGAMQDDDEVSQLALNPGIGDPKLWMFKCQTGKEQETVIQIMNKARARALDGTPLGITGALATNTKGVLYIEGASEPSVIEAVKGVRGMFSYTMKLIPVGEMTTVMNCKCHKVPVKVGQWVRMQRDPYKGDLAQVVELREGGLKAIIRTVPRIDIPSLAMSKEEVKARRKIIRPPRTFFNREEIEQASYGAGSGISYGSMPGMSDKYEVHNGNYFREGYMFKECTVGTVVKPVTGENPPTIEELQLFRKKAATKEDGMGSDDDDDEDDVDAQIKASQNSSSLLDDLAGLPTVISENGGGLNLGDIVEVVDGDLVGMRGKLTAMDDNTVKMKPLGNSGLDNSDEIEFMTNQVCKYIAVGAHVKVTDGRFANETGVVVATSDIGGEKVVVILTDLTHKELTVRVNMVKESAEVSSGQDKLQGYELHDLVVVAGGGATNDVAVITRVGREDFDVIDNYGNVRLVRPEELRGKRNQSSNRAVALDVQGNQIKCNDTVNVVEGPHKNKTGTIKHIYRSQIFLHSQTRTENAGIFACRARSCVLAGARQRKKESAPTTQFNARPQGRAVGGGQDELLHKSVRITGGIWKGYLGTVVNATAEHVNVELHSRMKKVLVLRAKVAIVGDSSGAYNADPMMNNNGGFANSLVGSATPMFGGQTPMHGGETPMHSSSTPNHDGGYGVDESGSDANPVNESVWAPGGEIDREVEEERDNEEADFQLGSGADGVQANASKEVNEHEDAADDWGASMVDDANTYEAALPPAASSSDYDASIIQQQQQQQAATGDDIASSAGGVGDEALPGWMMVGVVVNVVDDGSSGVIKEINNNTKTATIQNRESQEVAMKNVRELEKAIPNQGETVVVWLGGDIGTIGELVMIDTTDAILKLPEEEGGFKIVDHDKIALYHQL
jgi:transcription elongation factor SPT5